MRQHQVKFSLIFGAVFLGLLAGCSMLIPWGTLYDGDGEFEKGAGVIQVRLGRISMLEEGHFKYKLHKLGPAQDWLIGFRIEPIGDLSQEDLFEPNSSQIQASFVPSAEVSLVLRSGTEPILQYSGTLDTWVWNWNHVAARGDLEEYHSGPNTLSYRRLGVGPHGGWGTHFTPRYSVEYTLEVQILKPSKLHPETEVWLTVKTYLGSL